MHWSRAMVFAVVGLVLASLPGCGASEDPDLIKTKSGLKYKDIQAGNGETAEKGDRVFVHYTGKLRNGKQFDSSIGKRPIDFILGTGAVIKGWDEGLLGMKVGGKRKLVIPPELGYGKRGAGEDIPPDSVLHFDVELVDIRRPKISLPPDKKDEKDKEKEKEKEK